MSYLDPRFRYHGHATHADPTAFARRMRERRRRRAGTQPKGAPDRPAVQEGGVMSRADAILARVEAAGHGWPAGQHVAEVNPFRDDAPQLAAGLVAAVNGYRELTSALRILTAATRELIEHPHLRAVVEAEQAVDLAACTLSRASR